VLQQEKKANSSAGLDGKERRRHPRYPFSASADLVHMQADTRLSGRVSDLSQGGCYLDTISSFPVGADVKIRIVKDSSSFAADGRVLYGKPGMGMGLAFTKIEPERMLVLEGWLRELNGESPQQAKTSDGDVVEPAEAGSNSEAKYVLNELIVALIRKRVLTEAEGNALLRKLMG
jgi:PilZ domain